MLPGEAFLSPLYHKMVLLIIHSLIILFLHHGVTLNCTEAEICKEVKWINLPHSCSTMSRYLSLS